MGLEGTHAIAQRRRLLEVEVRGRRLHLLLEASDVRVELGLRPERRALVLDHRDGRVVALVDARQHVVDRLDDARRRDAVLLVVGLLPRAAALGLADGRAHRVGHDVGVHDHAAVDVAGGAAGRLNQRARPIAESLPCRRRESRRATLRGGRSPSRSRLMPTSTSNTPRRRSRRISTRSSVSMSECR